MCMCPVCMRLSLSFSFSLLSQLLIALHFILRLVFRLFYIYKKKFVPSFWISQTKSERFLAFKGISCYVCMGKIRCYNIKNRKQYSVMNTHTPIYKIFSVDNLIIPELKATNKLYVDTILILFTFILWKRCIEC